MPSADTSTAAPPIVEPSRPASLRLHAAPALAGIVLLLLALAPLLVGRYYLNVILLVLLYTYLGSCWNLIAGYAGQFSLAQATFFGLGGYVSVYLFRTYGISPWIGLPLGAVAAAGFAAVIGLAVFRYGLKGSYFAIATLAVSEIVRLAFNNAEALGGGGGMTVPLTVPGFATMQFGDGPEFYYIFLGLAAFALAFIAWIARIPFGYRLRSLRENDVVSASLGIDNNRNKLAAFVIGAALTAPAGTFYAHYVMFVDPNTFLSFSVMLLIMLPTLVGGAGTVLGPLWGAFIMVGTTQLMGSLTQLPGMSLLVYGVVLILASFGSSGWSRLLRSGRTAGARP